MVLGQSLPGRIAARGKRAIRRVLTRSANAPGATKQRFEVVGGKHQDRLVEALTSELKAHNIGYVFGGVASGTRPRIHFRFDDAVEAIRVLEMVAGQLESCGKIGPAYFKEAKKPLVPVEGMLERFSAHSFKEADLWLLERQLGGNVSDPHGAFSLLEIDFWTESATTYRRDSESYVVAPRANEFATTMRRSDLDRLLGLQGSPTRDSFETFDAVRDLYSCDFPIDAVYTWVDDEDPAWMTAKARHASLSGYDPEGSDHGAVGQGRAYHDERFRNRDELKFSLRSLEMFAPWIRHIYVVTMDQVPEWLDTSHPKITVVSHRDIYSDPGALPTFNSSSIETQLHHIDGLAEHFIYFNDDVFLGRPCSWRDFFLGNGAARFVPARHSIASTLINDDDEEYLIADRNAIDLFAREFGFVVHQPMAHVPHSARRSVLYELESRFSAEFDRCQRARFRSLDDLRPIAFMGHHYGFATGRAVPGTMSHRYLALWKPIIGEQLKNVLESRRYQTFCINDVGVSRDREKGVNLLVSEFLARYFPYASSFERER